MASGAQARAPEAAPDPRIVAGDQRHEPGGVKVASAQASGPPCEEPVSLPSHNELFNVDNEDRKEHAWWLANLLLLSQPVFFGTWDGVFTSCLIHLVGAIVFLRAGWIVGNAGVEQALLIVAITAFVCCIALLAGVGITQRCHIDTGGIHDILSHILGARLGGAVSVVYCFGQAVSCALHLMAFAESISDLIKFEDPYIEKVIALVVLMCLLGVNLAGVKWVVRIQLGILLVLLLALSDFGVGVFVKRDPANGVNGLNLKTLLANLHPSYLKDQNWFTIFGVFFPAMTGICTGINMSSDLLHPARNIPTGTFSAIATAVVIYCGFVVGLGATCDRAQLREDYMIAEKVSVVGVLLLSGLYISSMSSSLGSLYATPRILQRMAIDEILPGSRYLAEGKGANKVPVWSMLLFSSVTVVLVIAGDINRLAPIVTIPFLVTYASVEYAYFNMAVTYQIQRDRREKLEARPPLPSNRQYSAEVATPLPGSPTHHQDYAHSMTGETLGHVDENACCDDDLERLFPDRRRVTVVRTRSRRTSSSSSASSFAATPAAATSSHGPRSAGSAGGNDDGDDEAAALIVHHTKVARTPLAEVARKPDTWYFRLFNKWIALLGAALKVTIMFLVEWRYSALALLAVALLTLYISKSKPQSHTGISEWSLHCALKNSLLRCLGRNTSLSGHMVVPPPHPGGRFTSSQLNYDGPDYAGRKRYHQATAMQPAHHYQDFDGD